MSGDPKSCFYRSPDGKRRCALGYLIPDEIYHPEMEGCMAFFLPSRVYEAICADYVKTPFIENSTEDQRFLWRLQMVHDENPSPKNMKKALEMFAIQNGLTIPELPFKADAPVSEDAKVERIAINA